LISYRVVSLAWSSIQAGLQTDMGGPNAKMNPAESVTKLRRLIDTLGPAQSGKFFNYDGREYPW